MIFPFWSGVVSYFVMLAVLWVVILSFCGHHRRKLQRRRDIASLHTTYEICGLTELERSAFRPLPEIVAEAEAAAEREHRKAYGVPDPSQGGPIQSGSTNTVHHNGPAVAGGGGSGSNFSTSAPVSGGGGIYPGPAGPFGVIAAWGPGDRQPDDIEVTAVGDSERKFIPGPGSTLENLRHRRLQVWEQAKRLATHAAAMERTFYPHEQVLWDRLNDEMDVLDKRIRHMLDLQGRVAARQFQVDELAARRARKRLDGPPGR